MVVISSRTPEGEPLACPVCGHESWVEPSSFPTADAPCPCCGHLLWATRDGVPETCESLLAPVFFDRAANRRETESLRISWGSISLPPSPTRLLLHEITNADEVDRLEPLFANEG